MRGLTATGARGTGTAKGIGKSTKGRGEADENARACLPHGAWSGGGIVSPRNSVHDEVGLQPPMGIGPAQPDSHIDYTWPVERGNYSLESVF